MIGKRFGRLIVTKLSPNTSGKRKRLMYYCDCDCGKKNVEVIGEKLRSGHTKSCGCLRSETTVKLNKKFNNYEFKDYGIGTTFNTNKEFYFDLEDRPEFNNWIDVEGIGYGWMWCANKLRSKFEFLQRRAVKKYALSLLKNIDDDTDIVAFYYDDLFVCGFIPKDNPTVYIQIRLSNRELHFDF